jgi:SET family sugar efflux transporter-like MFS transporter
MNSLYSQLKERTLYVWNLPSFPVLFLANFIFGLSISFVGPYYSLFGIDEVGMSNISFGVFMTVMSLAGIIISTYLGKLSDKRVTRRRMLLISSVAAIIGYAGFAFIRDYYSLLFIAIIILGISSATIPQLWAYAREVIKQADVPEKETPYVMNVFRMFFALSWTVGPALAAWILIAVGFKGLFLFASFGYLLAVFIILRRLKDVPRVVSTGQQPIHLGKFILTPHIFANIVAFFLLTTATSINMMNTPQFVTKVLGGSEMNVGIIFSIPPLFEVPFMIGVGILATRWDNGLLIRLGFLISFIYFLLIILATEPWHIYPIQILSAAQVSITTGIAVTYFQNFIPDEPGTATTLYMNTMRIGSTLGFLLFGLFSEYLGYRSVFLICTAFAGIGLLLLLAYGKEKIVHQTNTGIEI